MKPLSPKTRHIVTRTVYIVCDIVLWGAGLAALYILALYTVFDTFHTPSTSMYPTLLPGDHGYVNKLKLGGRSFDIFAAHTGKPYTVRRMPGYGHLERNDVVVFNAPYRDSSDTIVMNTSLYYCKRVVAVAGDTLEIADCRYRVRGYDGPLGDTDRQDLLAQYVEQFSTATPDKTQWPGWMRCLPYDSVIHWTVADMGPLLVPAEGTTVTLDRDNYVIYRKYIEWETGRRLEWHDTTAVADGTPVPSYTFTENYCFAAGDNAIDSKDSRYWGLLPEKFIVGVASFIIGATDKTRLLKPIK